MMSQKNSKVKGRLVLIVSVLSFGGSLLVSTIPLFRGAEQPKTTVTPALEESSLKAQEQGYQLVLQREPENQVALQGLAKTKLQLNDPQGAIAPLEQLIKLNPYQTEYTALLAEARQKAKAAAPSGDQSAHPPE